MARNILHVYTNRNCTWLCLWWTGKWCFFSIWVFFFFYNFYLKKYYLYFQVGGSYGWRYAFLSEAVMMVPFVILGFVMKPLHLKGTFLAAYCFISSICFHCLYQYLPCLWRNLETTLLAHGLFLSRYYEC